MLHMWKKVIICHFSLAVKLEEGQDKAPWAGGAWTHMAPEIHKAQKKGQQPFVTTSTDVYAAGVLFYELFSHHHPFVGEDEEILDPMKDSIIRSVQDEEPRDLSEEVPQRIRELIMSMLEKNPLKRAQIADLLKYWEIDECVVKLGF
ncbi:MAG: hypothetical protein EZS28_012624 [Streblomastix strix]|uniref:Protein kinase domain-containing protein n=1 Tax=Streblomastix strix TaxID=222440 RepID=A0A5J4WAQ1_9EUKA|nr:MAG: hypothetical protein EZS28_012624 [Streblomastix strix]